MNHMCVLSCPVTGLKVFFGITSGKDGEIVRVGFYLAIGWWGIFIFFLKKANTPP